VIIPIVVLEEIDTFKKGQNENGRNSRQFSRELDALTLLGDISEGIPLKNSGYIRIDLDNIEGMSADNRVIETAVREKTKNKSKKVLQFTLNGDLIKEWNSVKEASQTLKINSSTIAGNARNNKINKSAGGYIWKYKN
jgi:hypothetical protein